MIPGNSNNSCTGNRDTKVTLKMQTIKMIVIVNTQK